MGTQTTGTGATGVAIAEGRRVEVNAGGCVLAESGVVSQRGRAKGGEAKRNLEKQGKKREYRHGLNSVPQSKRGEESRGNGNHPLSSSQPSKKKRNSPHNPHGQNTRKPYCFSHRPREVPCLV